MSFIYLVRNGYRVDSIDVVVKVVVVKVMKVVLKLKTEKQAENGLQSRSSENGKTAVWHYGLKLRRYLTVMDYHELS